MVKKRTAVATIAAVAGLSAGATYAAHEHSSAQPHAAVSYGAPSNTPNAAPNPTSTEVTDWRNVPRPTPTEITSTVPPVVDCSFIDAQVNDGTFGPRGSVRLIFRTTDNGVPEWITLTEKNKPDVVMPVQPVAGEDGEVVSVVSFDPAKQDKPGNSLLSATVATEAMVDRPPQVVPCVGHIAIHHGAGGVITSANIAP